MDREHNEGARPLRPNIRRARARQMRVPTSTSLSSRRGSALTRRNSVRREKETEQIECGV